jgi:hypothetical protein
MFSTTSSASDAVGSQIFSIDCYLDTRTSAD